MIKVNKLGYLEIFDSIETVLHWLPIALGFLLVFAVTVTLLWSVIPIILILIYWRLIKIDKKIKKINKI